MNGDEMKLLREYASRNSEPAFETLVQRHINLVYSVALRRLGNTHAAEEVTQAVFVILARKASTLRENTILSGWLYQTTRLTAANFERTARRRKFREQEAYMQCTQEAETDNSWQRLSPLLEEAMTRLGQIERDALVLRFFENRTIREVAHALGLQEAATQKRVNRATEKVRKYFLRRGVQVSAVALLASIGANAVQAAPAALTKTVTAMAVTNGASVGASTVTLIKGALKVMAWSKAKTAIAVGTAIVLAISTTGIVMLQASSSGKSGSMQNEEVVADRTTPRGALLVMANALQSGDAKAYVESYMFVTPDELKLKGFLGEFVTASARFSAAAADRFGIEQARQQRMPLTIPTELFKTADVKIVGDSATVDLFKNFAKGAKTRPIQLIKVGNEWKLKGFGLLPVEAAELNSVILRIIAALNQTAVEIPQGKYKTAAEAVKTMKDRADY
jgi:RNA polymerase sigma factor (sigma-70 family)